MRRDFARKLDAQERPARRKIAHRPVYQPTFDAPLSTLTKTRN
jgi:hypothetical protein